MENLEKLEERKSLGHQFGSEGRQLDICTK